MAHHEMASIANILQPSLHVHPASLAQHQSPIMRPGRQRRNRRQRCQPKRDCSGSCGKPRLVLRAWRRPLRSCGLAWLGSRQLLISGVHTSHAPGARLGSSYNSSPISMPPPYSRAEQCVEVVHAIHMLCAATMPPMYHAMSMLYWTW